ncbi:MAG: hypothetical protein LBL01_00940, partial [Bifidobacteriaceae bacterium]|nr:hypothetical protein [Bifidobacteriaceae bacterium]
MPARVERPVKRSEYEIVFATRQAEKGWRDLRATALSPVADAWDALTSNPVRNDRACHPLRGYLAEVRREGATHIQRQYELPGGARIWYYV